MPVGPRTFKVCLKTPRWRAARPGRWVVGGVESLFLIAVVLGLYFATRFEAPGNDDITAADARTASPRMLDKWYPPPTGPNAADAFHRAFAAYTDNTRAVDLIVISMEDLSDPTKSLTSDTANNIAAHLADQARAIALLEAACDIESCQFEYPKAESGYPATMLGHHAGLRYGAQVLYLSAVLENDQYQTDLACQRVRQIVKIADILWQEPNIVATLLSYRIRSFAYDLTARLVLSGRPTDENLDTLLRTFESRGSHIPAWCAEAGLYNSNTRALYRSAWVSEARTNIVRAAIAAEMYRRAHGVLPGSLDDLVPQFLDRVPLDTFDALPLKYRTDQRAAVVYSIGPDRTDNGGTLPQPCGSSLALGSDIGVRFTNAPDMSRPSDHEIVWARR